LEGTEHCSVIGCNFSRLDSNALFLSGYNRFALVQRNNFEWLGQSAIASWGRTNYNDGTDGDQPRFSMVVENFLREIGHIQKQSSFYCKGNADRTRSTARPHRRV
jgi:hypothetical protein